MARHFGQLKRMIAKVERLKELARTAGNPRIAEKYLRQADEVLRSIQAIKDNWSEFGERARGNANFKGAQHTQQARQKMSEMRKAYWASKAGFEKMWRARRRRQYREAGKCLIRFPRIPASVDKEWLKDYRERYRRIIGKRPKIRFY